MLLRLVQDLDRLGLRRLVAWGASLAYDGIEFSVDDCGFWVNRQRDCTIVSQTIHTQYRADLARRISDYWLYCYRLCEGDVVFDVGAGIGEEALVFSPIVGPSGRIVSIEAHPQTFECLSRTVHRSGLINVEALACAVADRNATARIGDSSAHLGNSILREGAIEVPQRTIGSIARERGIERIDFLRMNIEGAEKLAVLGMAEVDVRNLCISCHDFCDLPSKAEVIAALEDQGYKVVRRDATPEAPWLGDYVYASKTSEPSR